MARLEHVNITVPNPEGTAALLGRLFGWKVRWQGAAMASGRSVHVGGDADYIALYSPGAPSPGTEDQGQTIGGLNHIGIVVDDLDSAEQRVKAEG